MEGEEEPIPLHRRLLGMAAWTVATVLGSIVIGGVCAALICLFNGSGFSDGYFPEKWRSITTLFTTFLFGLPIGDKLGRALIHRPRFPGVLIWFGLTAAGTAAFAAIGQLAGKLLVNANDAVYFLYAFTFLVCVLGQAALIVCEAITGARAKVEGIPSRRKII